MEAMIGYCLPIIFCIVAAHFGTPFKDLFEGLARNVGTQFCATRCAGPTRDHASVSHERQMSPMWHPRQPHLAKAALVSPGAMYPHMISDDHWSALYSTCEILAPKLNSGQISVGGHPRPEHAETSLQRGDKTSRDEISISDVEKTK